jgi:putative restriction endonuclease
MSGMDSDTAMRAAAFANIRRLNELRDVLSASDLAGGFQFGGARIPLINPQRGIFKPTQMKYLLSIKTVFRKPERGHGPSDFRSVVD